MTSSSIVTFITGLLGGNTGVRPFRGLFDQRLTTTRAAGLDNLGYLTGPAALQAVLGTPTDALSATTSHALVQLIENLICDIETQIRQLGSGPGYVSVFNVNTTAHANAVINASQQGMVSNGNNTYVPPAPYSGAGYTPPPTNYTPPAGYAFINGIWACNTVGQTNNPFGLSGGDNEPGSCGYSGTTYSPASPPQQLVPPTTSLNRLITVGTKVQLQPIAGCGSSLASGVGAVLNGQTPPVGGTIYPFVFGTDNGPYIGIKRGSDNHWYFVAKPTSGGSETAVAIDTTVGGALSGQLAWPVQFFWSGNTAPALLIDQQGNQFQLPGGAVPVGTLNLPGHFAGAQSGLYQATVGYA